MTHNLVSRPFKALNALSARSLLDHYTEVVDVKDYGAIGLGNATNDDSAAIQAAINVAFGAAGSPHGLANWQLNKPLFFPPGSYILKNPIVFPPIYNGLIFGSPVFTYAGSNGSERLVRFNGLENSRIENMSVVGSNSNAGFVGIDLDLTTDPNSGVRLNSNTFTNFGVYVCDIGCRIAHSGHDGANNLFYGQLGFNANRVGILCEGANAKYNKMWGFAFFNHIEAGLRVTGGNFSFAGGFSNASGYGVTGYDYDIQTTDHIFIGGGRTESNNLAKIAGDATLAGIAYAHAGVTVNMTGSGKVVTDGVIYGGGVQGTGTIYNRGISWVSTGSGFTGTMIHD